MMDSWPEDVKAMLAAGQLREEAIRAAELSKLPELGAKEAGPLAAGGLVSGDPTDHDGP